MGSLYKKLGILVVSALFSSHLLADSLTADEIMARVDAVDVGDHVVQDVVMVLVDAKGNQRQQQLRLFRKSVGEDKLDTRSIMFYTAPDNVEGTAFLSYDYDDVSKEDEQWLYMPALKKTKRIAASDKSGSFMGSDLSYADMSSRNSENYTYKLIKESEVEGQKVWVIEATPTSKKEIKETGYTKSLHFVRQDNYVVVRSINKMKKAKRTKFIEVKKLEKIDGIWVQKELIVSTKKSDQLLHKTIMQVRDAKFNQNISDDMFTLRKLENGL